VLVRKVSDGVEDAGSGVGSSWNYAGLSTITVHKHKKGQKVVTSTNCFLNRTLAAHSVIEVLASHSPRHRKLALIFHPYACVLSESGR
jgi:hypothetical protein